MGRGGNKEAKSKAPRTFSSCAERDPGLEVLGSVSEDGRMGEWRVGGDKEGEAFLCLLLHVPVIQAVA